MRDILDELLADVPDLPGALCAETDPELFFPAKGVPSAAAKKLCGSCPAQAPCLEYAVKHKIRDGIWGGLAPKQRRPLAGEVA